MSSDRTDIAFRRLVAEIAEASNADIEAILGALEPRERRTVEAHLAAYIGDAPAAPVHAEPRASDATRPAATVIATLSPWLAARLGEDGPRDPGDETSFRMTPTAMEALRDSAARITSPAAPLVEAEAPNEPPWWNHLGRTIVWRRGRS